MVPCPERHPVRVDCPPGGENIANFSGLFTDISEIHV